MLLIIGHIGIHSISVTCYDSIYFIIQLLPTCNIYRDLTVLLLYLRCPTKLSHLQFFPFYSMAQINHVNKNQFQGVVFKGFLNLVFVSVKCLWFSKSIQSILISNYRFGKGWKITILLLITKHLGPCVRSCGLWKTSTTSVRGDFWP